jgi:hypothetical protein
VPLSNAQLAAAHEGVLHACLDVGTAFAEQPLEVRRRHRAPLTVEHLRRNAAQLGVLGSEVLDDPPAERPAQAEGIRDEDRGADRAEPEDDLGARADRAGHEDERGADLRDGIEAAGEERAGAGPDRGSDLAVDDLRRGQVKGRDDDPLGRRMSPPVRKVWMSSATIEPLVYTDAYRSV